MSKWISVEDRLPEIGENVLAYDKLGCVHIGHRRGKGDPDCWIDDSDEYGIWDVTHWMPLPEPPKEDE